ncbi:hypothetical protein CSW58_11725 [Caulobacter sp. B11]|nr:hypothetical protein CSW58_11725 [Caulobacter sp. B11]
MLELVETQQAVRLPAVRFTIRAQALGLQTPSAVISAVFRGEETPSVRILAVAGKVAPGLLRSAFGENDLLVLIEEDERATGVTVHPGFARSSCRIVANPERSARLIEDLIIDVTLGNYFRGRKPIAEVVDAGGGLPSLYARKVRFARRTGLLRGPTTAPKGTTYVMLSMLSQAADDDLAARAASAFETWQLFASSLTPKMLPSPDQTLLIDEGSGTFPFAQLQKIGAQLSMPTIKALLKALTSGTYVMAVLRSSSSVRKTPELRGQITGIFGEKARTNSLKIYPYDSYLPNLHTLQELSKSGHIVLVHFSLNDN